MHVSEEQLASVAKEVLETMAFAFEMPGEESGDAADALQATVEFRGAVCGALSLILPRTMLPMLVVNMLGVGEEEIPPEQDQRDAIGELANVICGNLVQLLAGPQPVFELAPPRVEPPSPTPDAEPPAEKVTSARIYLEDGWAEVTLVLKPEKELAPAASNAVANAPDAR